MPRAWEIAKFYRSQGVATIASGWHAHYCPAETLDHDIDLVVHGDGDPVIQKIFDNFARKDYLWKDVPGVSYVAKNSNGAILHNTANLRSVAQIPDMDDKLIVLRNQSKHLDTLPYPDFSQVLFARIKVYPVIRIRGCSKNCEFCSVRGKPCWASPLHLLRTVDRLV